MHDNTSFTNNVDTLFSDLQNLTKTETVLGSPVTVEDKTLVPVMSVTLGYGSTGMGSKSQIGGSTNTSSGGHGLGARVSTSGVIVMDKSTVQFLSTTENNTMGQLMGKLPQALSNIGQNMMGGAGAGQQQGTSQSQQSGQQSDQQNQQESTFSS